MIQVLLFATLAEIAGERSLQLELPPGATVRQVWELMSSRHPRLADHSRILFRSVNGAFATDETAVHDGDEVAFFPPVSGG